jgi:hypothetical protein
LVAKGTDLDKLRRCANAAIAGGKSRPIPGFDYALTTGLA